MKRIFTDEKFAKKLLKSEDSLVRQFHQLGASFAPDRLLYRAYCELVKNSSFPWGKRSTRRCPPAISATSSPPITREKWASHRPLNLRFQQQQRADGISENRRLRPEPPVLYDAFPHGHFDFQQPRAARFRPLRAKRQGNRHVSGKASRAGRYEVGGKIKEKLAQISTRLLRRRGNERNHSEVFQRKITS